MEIEERKLRTRLGEIGDRMHELVVITEKENRAFSKAEDAEFKRLDYEHNSLRARLENRNSLEQIDDYNNQPALGSLVRRDINAPISSEPGSWINRKTGEQIRCLGPGERVAESNSVPFSFGDIIRGMLVGAKTSAEIRALEESSIPTGGALVPSPLAARLIDALRAQSVCIGLGARTIPMDSKTLDIARIAQDPQAHWRDEASTVDEEDVTFDRLTFTARSMSFIVKASRELVEDASNLDAELRVLFAQKGAEELDKVALAGSGPQSPSTYQPMGLLNIDNVNETDVSGSLSSYDDFLDNLALILNANAAMPTGIALSPTAFVQLQKLKEGTTNAPLQPPPVIAPLPQRVTTALSEGGSPETSHAIWGNWTDLLFGIRTELNVRPLVERYADKGMVGFWCWLRADVQVAHAKSFGRIINIS